MAKYPDIYTADIITLKQPIRPVSTYSKISFKISLDGLQKLSIVLLVPILAIFVFSIYQIQSTKQSIDDIPLRIQASSVALAQLKGELDNLDNLKDNLKRSSERHSELLEIVDFGVESSVYLNNLDSWRSKVGLHRAQLKQDLDHLRQFNAEKNLQLNKLTLLLKKLLLQEDAQWISFQQLLEKHADKAANADEIEQYFQNYLKEFIHTIRALSAYRGSINDIEEKLHTFTNDEHLKINDIETELERYKISLQHYVILTIVSLVLGVIASCGAYGLRIRRERRSREPRTNNISVEYERRKTDRNVEYKRRKTDGS